MRTTIHLGLWPMLFGTACTVAQEEPEAPAPTMAWQPQGDLIDFEELGVWGEDEVLLALDYFGAREAAPEQIATSRLYRITYRTQVRRGEFRESTALATLPENGAPAPVMAWQHGTTGLADSCAPSTFVVYGMRGAAAAQAAPWLAHGYATVLTDYPGLGTEGVHPYVVADAAGAAALDGIRALHHLDEETGGGRVSNVTFLAGHSQGGHATLAAHQMVASYAPEIDYRGGLADAPGGELKAALEYWIDHPSRVAAALGTLVVYAWSAYYGFDLADYLNEPWLKRAPSWVESECLDDLLNRFSETPETDRIFGPGIFSAEFQEALERNSPRGFGPAPLRIQLASEDEAVPGSSSSRLFEHLCASANVVERVIYDGDHMAPASGNGMVDGVLWTNRLLDGKAPLNNCP